MSTGASEAEAATSDEVRETFNALTEADMARLRSYAKYRVKMLWMSSRRPTHRDLLHEALVLTLEGSRPWRKQRVGLAGHLVGAMRSISSHWLRTRRVRVSLDSDVQDGERGRTSSPGPNIAIDGESWVALGLLRELSQRLADDEAALHVLADLARTIDGAETGRRADMDQGTYERALERVQKAARQLEGERNE